MLRPGLAVFAFLLVLSVGCSNSNGPGPSGTGSTPHNGSPSPVVTPVTPVPKPAGVPDAARAIAQTTTLGRIVRRAGVAPQGVMTRQINAGTCNDGLMTLTTSLETVYAPLDCSSFWTPDTTGLFVGQQAALSLQAAATRFLIRIETLPGAQAEFTVAGIWVQ